MYIYIYIYIYLHKYIHTLSISIKSVKYNKIIIKNASKIRKYEAPGN